MYIFYGICSSDTCLYDKERVEAKNCMRPEKIASGQRKGSGPRRGRRLYHISIDVTETECNESPESIQRAIAK